MNLLQYWWVAGLGLAALGVYLLVINWRKLAVWALEAAYKSGYQAGYAAANAEQVSKQSDAVQAANTESAKAEAKAAGLTDQEAQDLATTVPKRK